MAWSTKYKKSIDCSNPKGFSQKAHCAGRKARQKGQNTKSKSVSENIMKITEQDRRIFSEVKSKYGLTKESLLTKLFSRSLRKSLQNDKDIQTAIKNADKSLETAQKKIEDRFDGDKEKVKKAIPDNVRKYLGFDY